MVDCAQNRADRPLGDFAIPRLRALPYKINGKIAAACIRAAMARWNQVKGATPAERKSARSRLIAAAKKAGIDVAKFADEEKMPEWSLVWGITTHQQAHENGDVELHEEAAWTLHGHGFPHKMKDELDKKLPYKLKYKA